MPIPGIEEPQVLLSGLHRQFMNIPIKKRRFPAVRSESPPAADETNRCNSEETEFKDVPLSNLVGRNSAIEAPNGNKMNDGVSLGLKESLVPLTVKKEEEIGLSSCREMPPMPEKGNSDSNRASDEVYSDRSKWDLNTTMDSWVGSNSSDALTGSSFDSTKLGKADLRLNEKDVLNEYIPDVSTTTSEQRNLHRKLEFVRGFTADLPCSGMNSNGAATLSKLLSENVVGPNLSLQLAQQPATCPNLVRCPAIKLEPVNQNSKTACRIGSSGIGSSNISSVKRELIENHSVVTLMPSSTSRQGLTEDRSMKPQLVDETNEESSKIAELQRSIRRVMQHQESCASSYLPPMSSMDGNPVSRSDKLSHGRKEIDGPEYVVDGTFNDAMIGEPSGPEKSKSEDSNDCEEACNDGQFIGLGKNANISAELKVKTSILAETVDKASPRSDFVPHENQVDTSTKRIDKIRTNGDEYEDGEIRETLRNSAGEVLSFERKKIINSQSSVPLNDEVANEESLVENCNKNCGGPGEDSLVDCHETDAKNNTVPKVSVEETDGVADGGSSISTTEDKQLDQSREIVAEVENKARDNFDKEKEMSEASPKGNDMSEDCRSRGSAIESDSAGNKSRIITLPSSIAASKFTPKRLLASKRGRERDVDRERLPGGRRFAEGKIHGQSFSRRLGQNFRHERTVFNGDFGSEAYNRPPNSRVGRHKYASSEFEREPYDEGAAPDNTFSSRRRPSNDDISSFRRWGQSPGDMDRDIPKHRRIHRNISPSHYNMEEEEDSSTFVGFRHADKFLRRLSSDSRSRAISDEFDGQTSPGNRRFSPIRRKGFRPRMRSKSPIRNRTRSPNRAFHEEIHCGNVHSDSRRSPPLRLLRTIGDGNKFHLPDSHVDERRKLRGHLRSFGVPSCNDDEECLRFPRNDGPRVYGFSRDAHQEFEGRAERLASGRVVKGGSFRPGGRVWCDKDFSGEVSEGDKRGRY